MSTMNDEHGCSQCVIAGDERFHTFRTSRHGELNEYWHYDYRAPNGELFSTIADTLEECRARRNSWLAEHDAAAYYDLRAAEADAGDDDLDERALEPGDPGFEDEPAPAKEYYGAFTRDQLERDDS